MKLQAESLCFSYGNKLILSHISLDLHPGELTFLLGENGAGKSTLFRCLLGQLQPQQGRVLLDGKSVHALASKTIAKGISYIPQATMSAFQYSVLQMVLMGRTTHLHMMQNPRPSDYEMARNALRRLGIEALQDRGFNEISGGERQLSLIARALVQESDILLMDEPISSLDYGNQLRVLQRIRGLTEEGHSIFLSSHNPQHALQFADRVIALVNGSIAASGKPGEVLNDGLLWDLYHVKVKRVFNGQRQIIIPDLDGEG